MQYDRLTLDLMSSRSYTDNGYLKVPGRVAKTGVQNYYAVELGLHDREPTDIVGVLREAEEVFASDSLSSYADADVTNSHPDGFIDSHTYKQIAVGNVSGTPTQNGHYVEANLVIKDKKAINAIEQGKVQLSAGYNADYERVDGVYENQPYEFTQKNIRINHVALVDKARAGASARLYDSGEPPMAKLKIGDVSIFVRDEEQADAGIAALALLDAMYEEIAKKKDKEKDKKKAEKDSVDSALLDAEKTITDLQSQLSDEALDTRVAERSTVIDKAIKITGKTLDHFVGKPLSEVRKESMVIADSDRVEWSNQSEAYIDAAFDMQYSQASRTRKTHDAFDKDLNNQRTEAAKVTSITDAANLSPEQAQQIRDEAYENYKRRLNGEA